MWRYSIGTRSSRRLSRRPPSLALHFLLEMFDVLSGIFLHREWRRLGHISQQACGQTGGNGTAQQAPERSATVDYIHCCSPSRRPVATT